MLLDTTEYGRWMASASARLRTARTLASVEEHAAACFHAEQATQLAVKALLHGIGSGERTHDLVRLGGLLVSATGESLSPEVQAAFAGLSRHYVATRYPDAHGEGTPEEHYAAADAARALDDAQAGIEEVQRRWRLLVAAAEQDDG